MRPYRDNELRQVQTVMQKVQDFRAEVHEGYLGEAEKILVEIEAEFAFLIHIIDEYDEEEAMEATE